MFSEVYCLSSAAKKKNYVVVWPDRMTWLCSRRRALGNALCASSEARTGINSQERWVTEDQSSQPKEQLPGLMRHSKLS